jgi:hypothetical protein
VADALDTLRMLQGDEATKSPATLVTVVTSEHDYEGMILATWKLERNAADWHRRHGDDAIPEASQGHQQDRDGARTH